MKPYIYGPKFMWNLDASVGKGAANSNHTDISFIQWYYVLSRTFHLTTSDAKAVYQKVSITGNCTGQDSDPLVQSIMLQQRAINHSSIDGRVSVVTGDGKVGQIAFFLLRLEARLAVMYPQQWPRLDLIPHCPPKIADISRGAVPSMEELTR